VIKNSVRRKRGDGETIYLRFFSLPSFISWRIQIPKRETLVKDSNDNFEEGSALADDLNNERFSFRKYTELLCKKSRKKVQNLIPRKDIWRSVRSSSETTKTASVDFTNLNKSILRIESQIIARKISEDEAIKKELEEERLARLAEERAKALCPLTVDAFKL